MLGSGSEVTRPVLTVGRGGSTKGDGVRTMFAIRATITGVAIAALATSLTGAGLSVGNLNRFRPNRPARSHWPAGRLRPSRGTPIVRGLTAAGTPTAGQLPRGGQARALDSGDRA